MVIMHQLLVSKREAASALGLCVRTIEKLIALKQLPARRVGRRCLIEKTALERFARRDHRTNCPDDAASAKSCTAPLSAAEHSGNVTVPTRGQG
jgi:excisionase family DNA binding protein